ncbi:MAG: NUDIX domain-containing protein [Micromonosporaceae bacterium]
MDVVDEWDGRRACALQGALRMTGEEFAEKLGTAVRTVRDWHGRPDMKPRQQQQQALDTLLEFAPESARRRFQQSLRSPDVDVAPNHEAAGEGSQVQALTVAIALVVTDDKALLVCRRYNDGSGILWQFPAGVVKPGSDPRSVAVRETLAETGVHCAVGKRLGSRLHPLTGVYCDYYLCDYLAGEPENMDPVENASVIWAPRQEVTRFIPENEIYPPVLHALMERDDEATS